MRLLLFGLAIVAILGILLLLFKQEVPSAPTEARTPASTLAHPKSEPSEAASGGALPDSSSSVRPQAPHPAEFVWVVQAGRLVSGPTVIQVHRGDSVKLELKADAPDELHLHGYDLHLAAQPGKTAVLSFVANRTGRFGIELHRARAELGALEVYP